MELLEELYKTHNKDKLKACLSERGLLPFKNSYYSNGIKHNGDVFSGLFFVIKSIDGKVAIVENRSEYGGWTKVFQSEDYIPIWNIDKILNNKIIIITESVIDSESINQINIPGVISVSFLKSSFSLIQFHMFMYLINKHHTVITAFDNDDSGVSAHDRFKSMAYHQYGIDVYKLPFPYKDINEFRKKSHRFEQLIKQSIKGIS